MSRTRELALLAEAMTTVGALEVIQQLVVDLLSQFGSSSTTCGTTHKPTDNGTSKSTQSHTQRAT